MKHKTTDSTEKRSVSGPEELFVEADKRAKAKRMTNFSEYVRDLIRQDLNGKLLGQSQAEKVAA